jgi:hypothetical protein
MPIKNPDGSIYKLHGPNKLMEGQDHWEKSKLTLHNFDWKPVVFDDPAHPGRPAPIPMGPPPTLEEIPQEPEEEVPEAVEAPPEPPEPTMVYHKPKAHESDFVGLGCHCLPATLDAEYDALYGSRKKTIQYGVPFITKIMPIMLGDVLAAFDTDDDRVTTGSILYPKTYEKRWWRVSSVGEHKIGVFTLYCEISDQQPYFSSS